jgi:hypothetical protein
VTAPSRIAPAAAWLALLASCSSGPTAEPRATPATAEEAHETTARETTAHETTAHETTAHETTAHETTAHETTAHESAAHETAAREAAEHGGAVPEEAAGEAVPAPDWLDEIADEAAWQTLAARSDEHAIARTEVVKVLWDRVTDHVYFCQSERWPLHYDFAVRFLESPERRLGVRADFNRAQYLRPDRAMQMLSLVRYPDAGFLTIELGPADTLDADGLVALHARLAPLVHLDRPLRFRPRSEAQIATAARAAGLDVVTPNEAWASVAYQPVTIGSAVGRLRFVDGELDPATLDPGDVVVLARVPLDLPLVAGVVTAELQAPLAHVAVLTQARGTPNMALRSAARDEALRALAGQLVQLEVRADGYTLAAATSAQIDAARSAPGRAASVPESDLARVALAETTRLRLGDASWAGAKAAQLGEVASAGVPTSAGFVVPLAHYARHLERSHLDVRATTLRALDRFQTEASVREESLASLRARIEAAPVDPDLVASIASRVRGAPGHRWIFRSSSNAEDLPTFAGAGLYDSIVTRADPDAAAIAEALRGVWASTYTRRGWDEREHAGVDHDAVRMAVLVQPFLDDVVATGVAVTENPFSARRSGILVDLAPAGGSVTAAQGGSLPEQILLYRHSAPEVVSRSGTEPLLRPEWLRPMRERLDRVHTHMMALWGDGADAADVELAVLRSGAVVILQARPYHLRR